MKSIIKSIFLLILTLETGSSFAQGWAKKKGEGYLKLAENLISSDQYYAPDGSTIDITTIGQYETSIYGEYGFTNRLTGLINFPFYIKQTLNDVKFKQSGKKIPGDELNGIGDADIGIKYGFFQKSPVVFSTSLILGLPLGKTNGGETGILQTGDGEFNQLLRFDVSHSFYPKPIYISAYSGFNNRTKDFSNEIRYGFEIGFPLKKFIPIFKLNGLSPLKNGKALTSQGSLFANNVEYLSPSFELNYQLSKQIGISGAAAFAFYGKNVLKAPNYNFGAYLKW